MTSNCYIIDTSSLVQLNRNNPLDVFPTIWKKLEALIKENRLVAPKEVLLEISQNDDQLNKWAKNQKKMFKNLTQKQIEIVKKILDKFPSLIDVERKYDADPWVIALAAEMANSSQKTLFQVKRLIVTEEARRGNKVRIPLVSDDFSIESIDVISMFRIEGWKF
ncbi:MAG: hypothetical protein FFODKBPE_00214 [Candidatus Argoarchaeum ethanivorans]|uniref:DUF4411 domain-containing protein n=1 Tax=Candidatus Argoarchaeum ethanivorans TaxID=2608793 RepID=A0A811T859_9EURY|nr:MAG: hypothetical protein FFODKBPE_00214 [Candidatus Argoarchaeum ethanivorans]